MDSVFPPEKLPSSLGKLRSLQGGRKRNVNPESAFMAPYRSSHFNLVGLLYEEQQGVHNQGGKGG